LKIGRMMFMFKAAMSATDSSFEDKENDVYVQDSNV